jgi:hypothetical protein
MSANQKKFTQSTETDLHFEMLADQSKLKITPNLVEDYNKNNLNENSDDEIIDNVNSDESLKFNNSSDNEDNESRSNHYDKDDFDKKKAIYNYQNKINESRFESIDENEEESRNDKRSSESDKKPKPTISELYNLDDVPFHMLDEQTQKFKKMEKYAELLSIKNTGIKLTKDYSFNSDYEEMCFEVQYWTNFQKKKDAVNLGKNFMMNAITALEFMNERYDPFGLKLKGWSDQMQIGQDGYSDVFGELYEKYKSSGKKIEPEIKLLLMISASAVSFHASKKMAEQLPGLDKVLESNPELLSKLQGAINNGISKNENDEPSIQEKQKKMYEQMQNLKAQQNKFNELKKQQEKIDSNTERLKQQMNNNNSNNNSNQKSNSKDISSILDRIRAQNAVNNADNVLNNDTSDSSDRVSVESTLGKEEVINNTTDDNDSAKGDTLTLGSDGQPKTRKRRGKPTISIST